MPAFNVNVTIAIEISASVEVTAKDEDAAQAKVNKMIEDNKLNITWEGPKNSDIEFEEQDQNAEIESVDEA